MKNTS